MSETDSKAHDVYERVCQALLAEPNVTRESSDGQRRGGFGSSALKVDGRIFALLSGGHLVVKLPRHEVDALVTLGEGERFAAGKGRPMREWLVVGSQSEYQWLRFAREALAFVVRQAAA